MNWTEYQRGDQLNPMLISGEDGVKVEQFGIVAYLSFVNLADEDEGKTALQTSLVESRTPGSGMLGTWLENVKELCKEQFQAKFGISEIINPSFYRYMAEHQIPEAVQTGKNRWSLFEVNDYFKQRSGRELVNN